MEDKNINTIIDCVNNNDVDMIVLAVDKKTNRAVTWHRCNDNDDQTFNMIDLLFTCTRFDNSNDENFKTSKCLFDAIMNFATNMCATGMVPLDMFNDAVTKYRVQIDANKKLMEEAEKSE